MLAFASAHPFLVGAFVVVAVLLVANEIVVAMRSGFKLAPTDAVRLINDREPVIVDVRPVADFKKGRISGAVNLPMSRIAEAEKSIGKNKSRPVLLYCALGTSASAMREKLLKMGYEDVYALRGGLSAWQGASLPVTSKS